MEFRIANAARNTGQMLERMVREKMAADGIAEPDCVVCYGAGYAGPKPALNAQCSRFDKMGQGLELSVAMRQEALQIVLPPLAKKWKGTLVARKIKHTKGKDIRVCRTTRGVEVALDKGRQFFTPLVESDTEYRVWVYRKRVLSVYEKRLTEPDKNLKFGRNRDNGWTFHQLESEEIPESVRRVAVRAIAVLGLDFGAVDVLGKWNEGHTDVAATVLEVNSAPGVSDEHRSGIVKLVNRVTKWARAGCPARELAE